MNAEIWATIGTILATLLLLVIPGVFYTWFALEHLIGDGESYARAIGTSDRRRA